MYSLRQISYCTSSHLVILPNVRDPYFENSLGSNQGRRRITHGCGKLRVDVFQDSSEFGCTVFGLGYDSRTSRMQSGSEIPAKAMTGNDIVIFPVCTDVCYISVIW
jgi:hypothetical protein